MKYLYNDNFEKEFKVAESEAEFKTLSYEEKGLCIDTFYSVMFGQCSPLSHSDCDPGSWYDLDLLDDLGYRTMDEQFNLSQAIDADEIKPLTDDDLLKMFNSALNKYRIFNRKNDGYMVQPQTKEALVAIIEDALCVFGNEADLNFIDTSKITDMTKLFSDEIKEFGGYGFRKFNGDISRWDVSNVKRMAQLFRGSDFNGDISRWDVSNAETMAGMFYDSKFNGDISKWNVSNVKNMNGMFEYSLFNNDISHWDVSKVESMSSMFAHSIFNSNISSWVISNVEDMSEMFKDAKNFNKPLNNWNISSVSNMYKMFAEAESFNQSLNNWKISNKVNFNSLFKYAKVFNSELPEFSNYSGDKEDLLDDLGLPPDFKSEINLVEKKNATRASKLSY